jgi:quercetin dioxygenase-like cupin family protein
MKITHYKETPPDPVGEQGASGLTVRWVISEKDGAPNFSMRVFEVEPGGYSPYHKHPWEHEVFILEGRGSLVQGDEEFPLSRGDVIFIPPRPGGSNMKHDHRISHRVRQIKKSAIHEMTRLSKEIEDVAFLSWAKPTSDTPEHIKEAAIAAIRGGLAGGYSQSSGLLELRQEIAKKLVRDNHIPANPTQIVVTVGAIEGLAAAVMALIDPGDEVILPSPTYSTHIRQVLIASGIPVLVVIDLSWTSRASKKPSRPGPKRYCTARPPIRPAQSFPKSNCANWQKSP